MPESGKNTGTVVLTTVDGSPLAQDTRDKFAEVALSLENLDIVAAVSNPFIQHEEPDRARLELSRGGSAVEEARKQLDEGQKQLDSALAQLAPLAEDQIAQLAPELIDQQEQLSQQDKELAGQEAKIHPLW